MDDGFIALVLIGALLFVGALGGAIVFSDQPKIKELQTKYTELQTKYQNSICAHRGLEITTVEGIKLCMDPNTKALHKIEDK